MKKKTHGLSILLLKPAIKTIPQALKQPLDTKEEIQIGNTTCTLFYKQKPSYIPKWVSLFKSTLGNKLDNLFNSATSAMLLIPYKGTRFFAITFGYGKTLLAPDCFEENFGLKVVLNSVDPKKLRSIDTKSLEAVPVSRRNQASVATEFSDFGLDIEQDLIYSATGKPQKLELGNQLTGKDALKMNVPATLEDIPPLLDKLFEQYTSKAYKQYFEWIDHLSEVRNGTLINQLDEALVIKIKSKEFNRTWLSVPDIIEWADVSGFKYQQPKRGDLHPDIGWDTYMKFLGQETTYSINTFKSQRAYCISESSGEPINDWSIYQCIYCELEYSGETYSLNRGKWYQIDSDFLGALNKVIQNIPKAKLSLPEYSQKSEDLYNQFACEQNSTYFALMDKVLINYGGGYNKIEFCDIYTTDKKLIHVKRYGGSSVLSHLFSQGVVSAQLLLADEAFREKVNEKLPLSHKLDTPSQKPIAQEFEVVYAIASTSISNGNVELPLFSKISLRNCYNTLQMFGLKVSIATIQVVNPISDED